MKYLITIQYDGSKYQGLQKLNGKKTVQGELEDILTKMEGKPVAVKAAGRTDKGVHALDQKCHFELNTKTNPYRLRYYLNRSSNPALYVKDCIEIQDKDFHARFSVKKKIYNYKINVGPYDPIMDNYLWNYNKKLSIKKMRKAKKLLLGEHNYKVFVTGPHKTCESIIDYIKIREKSNIIEIEIRGQSFYTYMIRNIVSSLVLIGNGQITINDLKLMIDKQIRVIEYAPAPPNGLYLKKIEY